MSDVSTTIHLASGVCLGLVAIHSLTQAPRAIRRELRLARRAWRQSRTRLRRVVVIFLAICSAATAVGPAAFYSTEFTDRVAVAEQT